MCIIILAHINVESAVMRSMLHQHATKLTGSICYRHNLKAWSARLLASWS